MTTSTDAIYRVVRLSQPLLGAMRSARDAAQTTNARFIAAVVDDHLPGLLEDLKRIGFGAFAGESQTARLPFSDESATLGLLREASETVGLPATKLLELCIVAAVRPREEPKRRRGRRPKFGESVGTSPKRSRPRSGKKPQR